MHEKLKILVSAYACSPFHGSEPGMGWNFVKGLSKYHEVHVITEKLKWEKPVLKYLDDNPEKRENLNFYFIEKKRNKPLRKIWPPSYYWYYRKWQQKAYQLALELNRSENFDLTHQLNMVGYREPGYLWKIDKPFVWGPIGGLENSPWRFLPSLGKKGLLFYSGRNIINWWQRNFLRRPRLASKKRESRIIAATPGDALLIEKLWKRESTIMAEVGQEKDILKTENFRKSHEPLQIVWSGQHTTGKNLPLLINALAQIKFPYVLHILGIGDQTKKWQKLAKELQIHTYCNWYGWIERENALSIMNQSHVLCITSIKDLTSTVTLEALSNALPVVCLDHCGFAHVVNENCGIKISVNTPSKAANNFARALNKLYNDEDLRRKLSKGAAKRAADFAWDKKIDELNKIYFELLDEKGKKLG